MRCLEKVTSLLCLRAVIGSFNEGGLNKREIGGDMVREVMRTKQASTHHCKDI